MTKHKDEGATKWTIKAGDKVCTRRGKIAWTHDRSEAESWLPSIPGAVVVDTAEFIGGGRDE